MNLMIDKQRQASEKASKSSRPTVVVRLRQAKSRTAAAEKVRGKSDEQFVRLGQADSPAVGIDALVDALK